MTTNKFFHAGGPISSKERCYIIRSCEQVVLDDIFARPEQRQYVCILGSRQVGKTSLLYRIQSILNRRKVPNAVLDLSPMQSLDAASWYNQLAFRLHTEFNESSAYQDGSINDALTFISFLDKLQVVANRDQWGVIIFDEVASVPYNIRNSFFPSLRRLYNYRLDARATAATRFVFIFAGSFYPAALISDKNNSPFNISHEVEVPDFERSEVEVLLKRGATVLDLQFEPEAVEEIWSAARGHPFLTQKICQDLVQTVRSVVGPADVEARIDYIVNNSNDTHLRSIVRYLKDNPPYTELLRKVVVQRERVSMHRVENAGVEERIGVLTRDVDGSARVRNRIYERYLYAHLLEVPPFEEAATAKREEEGKEKVKGARTKAVEIFYSYAHEDEVLCSELEKHLNSLQRRELIIDWHDRKILAGGEWKDEIDEHLERAQVILLLVSPDFLASGYCFESEMKRAMERHERGEARVIPIILRPVDWQGLPFGKLEALPKGGKPVTLWQNRDEAFAEVAKGIREVVERIQLMSPVRYPYA